MSLIANSAYKLINQSILVNVGMDPRKDYCSTIIFTQFDDTSKSVKIEGTDFSQLLNLVSKIEAVFSRNSREEENEDEEEPIEIGEYNITLLARYQIIRFSKTLGLFLNEGPCLDLSMCAFLEIFNLNITIRYKLKLLEMYRKYAIFTHKRIVDYFIQTIRPIKNGMRDKLLSQEIGQSLEEFRFTLISLSEKMLPGHTLKPMYINDAFDTTLCELIESEIRSIGYRPLFQEVCNVLENSQIM